MESVELQAYVQVDDAAQQQSVTNAHAAQTALYQSQQLQFYQQTQQQPSTKLLRQLYSNQLMMMPQFLEVMTPVISNVSEEDTVYVNAKQYHRIMIRRQQRAKLEAKLGSNYQRKEFLHQSRHKHAMRRPRGPGGRFLTRAEIAMLKDGTLRVQDLPAKTTK